MNATLAAKIEELKHRRNAVILAHNYQVPEVQDIADFCGGSLQLSRRAAETDAEVIVFCGVRFMAETAAILCPRKTVLLPDADAGCPLADTITAGQLRRLKQDHPNAAVICYVNSSAEVKAESDYCCTSANAVAVVASLKEAEEIIFVPDRQLGSFIASQTGREMILWDGCCDVHVRIRASDIRKMRDRYPEAAVMVHPECLEEVIRLADEVLSTGGMSRYAKASNKSEFIVGTETGMTYRLSRDNPEKKFYPVKDTLCADMKLITLEKVFLSLKEMRYRVTVPDEVRDKAKKAIGRMVRITA